MTSWHQLDAADVLQRLQSDSAFGLSEAEAAQRVAEHGPNELIERSLKSPWRIWWEQLTATMVVILIVAAIVSTVLGDYKDAIAIIAIVVVNAMLGFTQEYRAEQAMAALKKLAMPIVKVRRDGHVREISARELVPGDIVLLEAGNLAPADGRLLESINLRMQEAALTGESQPVEKVAHAFADTQLSLGDRRNMVYMGTVVTYGRGQAVVTETGMATELGHIASMIQTVETEPTPLKRRLDRLGRSLAVVALAIVGVVFVVGLLRGEDARLMFLTAVSMAVAAVPEGLPAVVTIALALGAQHLLKRHALIRKLPAVETLGSVTVICSDKTGTLTENRMTVTVLDVANHREDFSERLHGDEPVLESAEDSSPALTHHANLMLLLAAGALCSDATLESNGDGAGAYKAVGDPTEGALVVAAAREGLWKAELEQVCPRVAEIPFDSERKRMTTIHQLPNPNNQIPTNAQSPKFGVWDLGVGNSQYVAFTKGAVDKLLDVSTHVWVDGWGEPMSEAWRKRIATANDQLAQQGMRVLGIAFRPLEALPPDGSLDSLERDLTFIGMVGMMDPARAEVKQAVLTCQTAGIRPVMITGDHPLTAKYIARELGIIADGRILTGQDLACMSVEDLSRIVADVSVYARVAPEHKLKLVQALQQRGHIVAMTGDGVNDAPALKKADIGIAMGLSGTDVAKEAADMVLLDDNFATIVAAVEQGRVIYDNIRKFIRYLLASNSGEIWVMLLAPVLGMPLALLPVQILWMNLVTDGLPALALSTEPAERNTMRRPPYHPTENIFGRGMARHILLVGLLMSCLSLGAGYVYWRNGQATWQTMVFTTLTLSQMALAMAVRSEHDSLFHLGFLSNKPLLGAIALTFIAQLAVVYVPVLQGFFETRALSLSDLLVSLILSLIMFWAVELQKWWGRHTHLEVI